MGIVLQLHSLWRWVILVVAIITLVKAWVGWLGKQPFGGLDNRLGVAFTITIDLQVLLGLLLWVSQGWAALIPQAMSSSALRFIAIEHPASMLLALALAHVGRSLSRKGATALAQHRAAAIFYLLSLAVIVAAIPWGGVPR